MKKILLAVGLGLVVAGSPALAIDGVYVGAEVGAIGGASSDALGNQWLDTQIGYGGDLGVGVNNLFDVMARVMHSSHNSGTLSLTSTTLAADFHVLDMGDFVVSLGAGPGFYFLSGSGLSTTKFGLNYGGEVDVVLSQLVHLGVGGRFHQVFSGNDYWAATMRIGFMFNTGG